VKTPKKFDMHGYISYAIMVPLFISGLIDVFRGVARYDILGLLMLTGIGIKMITDAEESGKL